MGEDIHFLWLLFLECDRPEKYLDDFTELTLLNHPIYNLFSMKWVFSFPRLLPLPPQILPENLFFLILFWFLYQRLPNLWLTRCSMDRLPSLVALVMCLNSCNCEFSLWAFSLNIPLLSSDKWDGALWFFLLDWDRMNLNLAFSPQVIWRSSIPLLYAS